MGTEPAGEVGVAINLAVEQGRAWVYEGKGGSGRKEMRFREFFRHSDMVVVMNTALLVRSGYERGKS